MSEASNLRGGTFRLPANLDSAEAARLATALKAARGLDLELDASEVRKLGGQCLQALLAARAAWSEDGFGFRFLDPSPEFLGACAQMGAGDLNDSTAETELGQ